jgi:hypothetical protein
MNEVESKTNGGTAIAIAGPDPFQMYADAAAPRTIVGKLLKFSKGEYLAGENSEVIEGGTEFVTLIDETLVGWVRCEDNKPVEQRMGRIIDGFVPPPRRELGDQDAAAWETGLDGRARDPWQMSNYLPLRHRKSSEMYTFVANSRGALMAVGELCRIYARNRKKFPNKDPVIRLESGEYQHRVKTYGKIPFPILGVIDWAPKSDLPEQPAPPSEPALDDEIPF